MPKERLDKLISSQSMMTRSEAAKLIKNGSVKINGKIIKTPSEKADPEESDIEINSIHFQYKKHIYIMMNKPRGIVSASNDAREKTVVDILPENLKRPGLFPAGRLDKDTTGFVLITDDGDFAHRILSPRGHVPKTYIAETDKDIINEYLFEMRSGMVIGEDKLMPAQITQKNNNVYEIVLHEGKYHQIKRMFAKSEVSLLSLKRIKIGNLPLDEKLSEGEARELGIDELRLICIGKNIQMSI